jgi:hypothetical protein
VRGSGTLPRRATGWLRDAVRPALVDALERATNGGLAFRPYASALAVETAINKQAEYGALVLGPGTPRLLLSSASGASVAQVLQQAAIRASQALGEAIPIVNLHPLPPGDPSGLAVFYATLAASIVGFAELWYALGTEMAVAALTCSVLIVLVGRRAIIPVWLLFVVLGNTSARGGAPAASTGLCLHRPVPAAGRDALLTCVRLLGRQPARSR